MAPRDLCGLCRAIEFGFRRRRGHRVFSQRSAPTRGRQCYKGVGRASDRAGQSTSCPWHSGSLELLRGSKNQASVGHDVSTEWTKRGVSARAVLIPTGRWHNAGMNESLPVARCGCEHCCFVHFPNGTGMPIHWWR